MATFGNFRNLHKSPEAIFPAIYLITIRSSWVFKYAAYISDVKNSNPGRGHVNAKMAVHF